MVNEKMETIFPLIDCNLYPSCKLFNGICNCTDTYIGETTCNVEECRSKYVSVDNKS